MKLPAEEVQKLIEEAVLWRGKMRYDGSRIQSAAASTYFGSGPYEYLISSIYKLGYEQGIDKVYIKDVSKRIEVTEKLRPLDGRFQILQYTIFQVLHMTSKQIVYKGFLHIILHLTINN